MNVSSRGTKQAVKFIDETNRDSASSIESDAGLVLHRLNRVLPPASDEGNTLIEVALMLPVFLGVVMAIYSFGTAYYNLQVLRNAVSQAGQALQIGGSYVTDPCAKTTQIVAGVAPTLNQSDIQYEVNFDNFDIDPSASPETIDKPWTGSTGTCPLTTPSELLVGSNVKITVKYPCNIQLYGQPIDNSCRLTAVTTYVVQ